MSNRTYGEYNMEVAQYLIVKLGEMGQIIIGAICVYALCHLIWHTINK